MDEIKSELAALAEYLDETHTLMHAGANGTEILGAAIFAVTKLTELVSRFVDRFEEVSEPE